MGAMSASYGLTVDALTTGDASTASKEFKRAFVPNVKEFYATAAKTYPTRFSTIGNWCAWADALYVLTTRVNLVLARAESLSGAAEGQAVLEATRYLDGMRKHFFLMHNETKTLNCADIIYAFREKLMEDAPKPEVLARLRQALGTTGTTARTRANPAAYSKAVAAWAVEADAVLADGQVAPAELEPLRAATAALYKKYGRDFE